MEWDDFISWTNENVHVEEVRSRVGQFERLLFSDKKEDKLAYRKKLLEERNRLAALLGISNRTLNANGDKHNVGEQELGSE